MELRRILTAIAIGGAIIGGTIAVAPAATAATTSCPDGWVETRFGCMPGSLAPTPPRQP